MPVFAFANAGVRLTGLSRDDLAHLATAGVAAGLALGKPLGVLGAVWLAVRLGVARLPEGETWTQMLAVGLVAGIGFTMNLPIGALAFGEGPLLEQVKLGDLAGSLCSGAAGAALMVLAARGTRLSAAGSPKM